MEHIKRFLTGFGLLLILFGLAFSLSWLLDNYAIYFLSVLGLAVTYGVGFVLRKM